MKVLASLFIFSMIIIVQNILLGGVFLSTPTSDGLFLLAVVVAVVSFVGLVWSVRS